MAFSANETAALKLVAVYTTFITRAAYFSGDSFSEMYNIFCCYLGFVANEFLFLFLLQNT